MASHKASECAKNREWQNKQTGSKGGRRNVNQFNDAGDADDETETSVPWMDSCARQRIKVGRRACSGAPSMWRGFRNACGSVPERRSRQPRTRGNRGSWETTGETPVWGCDKKEHTCQENTATDLNTDVESRMQDHTGDISQDCTKKVDVDLRSSIEISQKFASISRMCSKSNEVVFDGPQPHIKHKAVGTCIHEAQGGYVIDVVPIDGES